MDVSAVVVITIVVALAFDVINGFHDAANSIATVVSTRVLSPRIATLVLGAAVVSFVGLNVTLWSPRVPAGWEPWLSPPVGLIAGIIGGVTNVPGTPLVIYFYALRLTKPEFVSAVGVTFVLYKLVQLAAVAWFGLLSGHALAASLGLAVVALGGFRAGLAVQDRLARAPVPIPAGEVADFWRLAAMIRPQEGVIAPYEVAAPLSSRRHLYSLARRENAPPGFPEIPPEIRWVILRTVDVERPDLDLKVFTDQGFTLIHCGRSLWYLRR